MTCQTKERTEGASAPAEHTGLVAVRHVALGSSAELWRGFDPTRNHDVVIKKPLPGHAHTLRHETTVLGHVCDHPNIATLYGTIQLDGEPCMVLEAGEHDLLATLAPGVGLGEVKRACVRAAWGACVTCAASLEGHSLEQSSFSLEIR
eukprot:comp12753_c0_seq1/m.7871 comp12753_c0_seq1/g.7871  ORF comp12753_c0_seq1/g.7871 comp12753_c0_seq1/m.7871 type:complete len:148 (-) comp12753_c0_seq1:1403-1846(-)